jgi:phytanoyl-CoA hydroxylase
MAVEPARRVYDGLTQFVAAADEAERIRHTLYRDDATAMGVIHESVPERLSDDQLRFYREQGYLAFDNLLDAAEVAAIDAALSGLIDRRESLAGRLGIQEEPYYVAGGTSPVADDPQLRVRKLWKFVDLDPRLGALVSQPRLKAVLEQLIGEDHRLVQDMALLKPPFNGAEKPWHQDTAYFDWTPLDGIVGVWIAIDPATVDNGCMQVIPGTHLCGPAPHYHVRDCQLRDDRVGVSQAVVVPLRPGGALFFSGLLHHGTPPNRSADRRRAVQYHYAAANCTRMTIHEHAELFDDGGAYAGCRDWDLVAGMSRARAEV